MNRAVLGCAVLTPRTTLSRILRLQLYRIHQLPVGPEVGRVLVLPVLCRMDTRGSGSRRPSPQSPDQCSPHYCKEWSGRPVSSRNSLHLLPLQPQVLVGVSALLHPVNLRLRVGYPQSLVEAVLFVLVPLVFVLIDRLNETRPPQSPSLY